MKILRDPAHAGPCVLVLGMFDGVHLGHRELLRRGRALADAAGVPLCALTFDPHPLRVIAPDRAPAVLTTLPERAGLMAACGVDALCVISFRRETAATPPEDFLRKLRDVYEPRAVVCGFNYTFGDRGRGNGATLQAWGAENGCRIEIVPELRADGDTVSSSRIRKLLAAGDMEEAERLLARPYVISGRVADGKHLGRTMGFPTANVEVPEHKALPVFGVYCCRMTVGERVYPAVVNVGRHPTLPEGSVTVEAYALDVELMLYGKKVRLDFLSFRRPERRFDSVEALRAQIAADAEDARAWFAAHGIRAEEQA